MHRFTTLTRQSAALSARRAAVRLPANSRLAGAVRSKIDTTSVGNDPDAAMDKSHQDAIAGQRKNEPQAERVRDG